jgi:type VI secretion system protein ImpM
MAPSSQSGFYGKLPCRGDFMQRRVPQSFVDSWDAWLQQGLHASRQQLGPQWLEVYLTSPVWRFVLDEGVCGAMSYAGVMLPSVDRVGRYFPLSLLTPLEPASSLLEVACGAAGAWFDAAEGLARRALEANDLDLEAFDAEVEALAQRLPAAELSQSSELLERIAQAGFAGGGSPWHLSMLADSPQRAANAILSLELRRSFRPCALWWTQGSETIGPGWLVTSGLPAPQRFVAMLSGQWRPCGWQSVEVAQPLAQEGAEPPAPQPPEALSPLDVEVGAAHPVPAHGPGAAAEPRFVRRPEIGLWGLVAVDDAEAGARADLIADVAHDLAPQATLSAQVESARRALQTALGARAAAAAPGAIAMAFLLVKGTECALLWCGEARAVRVRGGAAMELSRGSPMRPPPQGALPDEDFGGAVAAAEDSDLLALLAAPAMAAPEVSVRYERLSGDDLWVLGAAAAPAQTLLEGLSDAWPPEGEGAGLERTLQSLLARHLPAAGVGQAPPLMLLAARISRPTAV